MDASIWDVRTSPDAAYRFAQGETLDLPPYDAEGRAARRIRLERPLDFAAVTDHAEFLGPVSLCTRKGSPSYATPGCRAFRGEALLQDSPFGAVGVRMRGLYPPDRGQDLIESGEFSEEICGEQGLRCQVERRSVWQEIQAAAERHSDRSEACRFTAFKAFEYSATPQLSKVHRNVIFRNAVVPEQPISWVDEPQAVGLWRALRSRCLEAGTGCDALAIPHNSNLSNGLMFSIGTRGETLADQVAEAELRAALEPLVEIMQIKGDSECKNGMYDVLGEADELCDFEKIRGLANGPEDCREGTGYGALAGRGCESRLDFVRYALVEGLREAERIGVNPYRVGFVASTDAHNANPGDVEERSYDGWMGTADAAPEQRLSPGGLLGPLSANPGGLVGIWAEENSRDRLFDAMQRRETFGTSGPRIVPRFFGGFGFEADLCGDPDLVAKAYAAGVPMGAELPARPVGGGAPVFVVSALRDPGTPSQPGGLLQRIQIVKVWADATGHFHQAVHDVAGSPGNGAGVDPDTCRPSGPGHDSLCRVWADPTFDPGRRAAYYARVVENPSCRWSARECAALPAARRPAGCSDPAVPKVIQERAWTSPIWYEPSPPASG